MDTGAEGVGVGDEVGFLGDVRDSGRRRHCGVVRRVMEVGSFVGRVGRALSFRGESKLDTINIELELFQRNS